MIKIKKSDKLVSLSLIMLLGVLFGSLAFADSTISVSPTSVHAGESTIVSWSGVPDPTVDDWIGLFFPGSDAEIAWLYVNCTQGPTTVAKASGSCSFPVPSGTAAGTYEMRFLINNGHTSIASTSLTVSTSTTTNTTSLNNNPTIGTINVVKIVINDNGRTKTVADFPLFVNGRRVISGATTNFPAPSTVLTVTETKDPNYTQSFSGDCDKNGQFNLNGGENKFCVVTNNDIGAPVVVPPVPPLINIVKIPSPLALPGGPGPVTYTYILSNIGTVPVMHVTLVGDTCGPIVRVSGDTNSDSKLDVNERWVYRCITTLTETSTNTITAIGWANDISIVDVAASTVVVGVSSVEPPLINVIKIPDRLVLPAGGGMVTYTNIVTNPGNVALDYVSLNDQQDSPMSYVSGDGNSNLKLDTNEVWTYTSRRNITETTTSTVSARGEVNGLVARDISVATVVVSATEIVPDNIIPTLPDTGDPILDNEQLVEPERNAFWNIIMLAVVIIFLIIIFFFNKIKKYE